MISSLVVMPGERRDVEGQRYNPGAWWRSTWPTDVVLSSIV